MLDSTEHRAVTVSIECRWTLTTTACGRLDKIEPDGRDDERGVHDVCYGDADCDLNGLLRMDRVRNHVAEDAIGEVEWLHRPQLYALGRCRSGCADLGREGRHPGRSGLVG